MNRKKIGEDYIYFEEEKNLKIYDKIKNRCYNIIKVFKDDHRSYVALVEIDENLYVLKIPREKNRRKWQRFLSLFRKSESLREFYNIKRIEDVGLNGAKVYFAVEKKKFGMSFDSYLVYSYLQGENGSLKEIDRIAKELKKIHKKGYLHGDSHIANFLVGDDKIYLIDTKLMKNRYGKFGEIFEFIYLEESCGKALEYDKTSFYYKGAMLLKRYLLGLGELKKRLKNRFKNR